MADPPAPNCVEKRTERISMTHGQVQEHIELIARHEQEFLEKRSPTERIVDAIAAFAGSVVFVAVHVLVFVVWIAVNTTRAGPIPRFDPAPFSLLGTLLTFEAILLASFILMRQSRLGRRADERDHLMLQLLLLMEKEITAALAMERHLATRAGLSSEANASEVAELAEHTSIDEVKRAIDREVPTVK
jgi:uncharacterized membrane protein